MLYYPYVYFQLLEGIIMFINFINNKKYKDILLELIYLISINTLIFKFTNYSSKLILIIDFFIIMLSIYDYFHNTSWSI